MRLRPELMQLEIGMSIRRYLPPSGTAGLARIPVRGERRDPAPPPMMIVVTLLTEASGGIAVFSSQRFGIRGACACYFESVGGGRVGSHGWGIEGLESLQQRRIDGAQTFCGRLRHERIDEHASAELKPCQAGQARQKLQLPVK